jgi:hypothetical protein
VINSKDKTSINYSFTTAIISSYCKAELGMEEDTARDRKGEYLADELGRAAGCAVRVLEGLGLEDGGVERAVEQDLSHGCPSSSASSRSAYHQSPALRSNKQRTPTQTQEQES